MLYAPGANKNVHGADENVHGAVLYRTGADKNVHGADKNVHGADLNARGALEGNSISVLYKIASNKKTINIMRKTNILLLNA